MIYLFCGTDTNKTRSKAFEWVEKARQKEPNLVYTRLSGDELTESTLREAVAAQSLFAKRTLTLIDEPSNWELLAEHMNEVEKSENVIVILAPRLTPVQAKKFVKQTEKTYEFNERARSAPERGFNSELVNALGARNKEKLWLEIVQALRAGDASEMLHGLLHWKARNLMQKGSSAWSSNETRSLSLALITLLQDSRRKGLDLSESLERFALTI